MPGPVPTFYLYGEPTRAVEHGFIHVERLDDRSRPNEWTILAHAHADLHQVFLVTQGGGAFRVEDKSFTLSAPALMVVPASVVHGFAWNRESAGVVLTLSRAYDEELTRRGLGLAPLFATFRLIEANDSTARAVEETLITLLQELNWTAPGRRAAMEAALLRILVIVLRLFGPKPTGGGAAPRSAMALVARYRARIEDRFRRRESVAVHAGALAVSQSRLRAACAAVAKSSPAAMLDQRTVLEARRALLYSTLSVAEIGFSLGFDDPAYFSRFLRSHTGLSPKALRSSHQA